MVTLKEIAQECNVSATTVSNILNGKPKVSEETRLKVLDVVKRRGYQPNYIAQGLRNQKTRTIGIIAEDIAPVSYTHLDVYKRQVLVSALFPQPAKRETDMAAVKRSAVS